jgi:hypothetical protein
MNLIWICPERGRQLLPTQIEEILVKKEVWMEYQERIICYSSLLRFIGALPRNKAISLLASSLRGSAVGGQVIPASHNVLPEYR